MEHEGRCVGNGTKDKEVMGNLNNQTWDELWNSSEAEKVRAKVRCCDRDCWMIGSVSPAMHKYIWKPATWVLVHKFKALFTKHPYSMYELKICRDYRDGKVTKEELDKYNNRLPYAAVCVGLILATKSSPLLFSVMFIFLLIYFQKRAQLKTRTVVFMAVIVLLLGTFQIQTYLMNVNAPRYLFFYYGGKTANTYFPLGSGFATFGSDQAARNYSRLYYQYGFNSLFGMNTEDGSFLSDTFWPMAIGQFGWIGSILYILIYVRIFFSFKWMNLNSEQKALLYAGYMQYIIHAVWQSVYIKHNQSLYSCFNELLLVYFLLHIIDDFLPIYQ